MTPEIPHQVTLPEAGDSPASVHLFDEPSAWAIRAALAANRPLLVRGEPGVGKSQLARAAAVWLNRPILSVVVDIRTESHDLMASFDAVRRLAEAQIVAARQAGDADERLAECKFVHPGKLWWAFAWEDACKQAAVVRESAPTQPDGWSPGDGCVLLIDEIDKAESDVPNGLLEALGSRSFPVRGRPGPVAVVGKPPLVVITTNEDRVLPNAFIRRCLVLCLELPNEERALRDLLVVRGQAHLPQLKPPFLELAANVVIEARNAAKAQHVRPLPGQAEYLDLIRAVATIAAMDKSKPEDVLNRVKGFVLNKNAGGNA